MGASGLGKRVKKLGVLGRVARKQKRSRLKGKKVKKVSAGKEQRGEKKC